MVQRFFGEAEIEACRRKKNEQLMVEGQGLFEEIQAGSFGCSICTDAIDHCLSTTDYPKDKKSRCSISPHRDSPKRSIVHRPSTIVYQRSASRWIHKRANREDRLRWIRICVDGDALCLVVLLALGIELDFDGATCAWRDRLFRTLWDGASA